MHYTQYEKEDAKTRQDEEGTQNHSCQKVAIPNIKIVAQMWYGYQIHEAVAIQRGKPILMETSIDEEFLTTSMPIFEVEEFRTLQ